MLNHISHGDPESSAILLLHGFMGSAPDWNQISESLSEDFYCIAPDLPGHGESTGLPDDSYTIEGTARAAVELMEGLGVPQAAIAGYSMGGRLALYLALRYPERCACLFLESASPGIEDERERASRREADEELAQRLEAGDFDEFLRDWYAQPLFASLARHEGMVGRLIESRKDNDPSELAKSLRGMGTGSQPSLWEELFGLQVPTLAVAGELDGKFVGISRGMSEASPKVSAEAVPGAGHNVHLESPDKYERLLRDAVELEG